MTAIPLSRTIEYPESDGQPMAETPAQGQVILDLYHALSQRYAAARDVYVWFNMFLYYVEGNPRASVAPDLFVAWGVDKKRKRRTYKVWEEGRAPSWICEVTSKSTSDEDTVTKKDLYEHLGVEEYFLFDPLGEYLKPRLQGYRLVGGRYQRLAAQADGSMPSQTTGLQLVPESERLRLRDAATGAPLPWQEEDAEARAVAERQVEETRRARIAAEREAVQQTQRADQQARKAEEERLARAAAEQRTLALEEELARLRRGGPGR
jgi:Uma2 family endonuclease